MKTTNYGVMNIFFLPHRNEPRGIGGIFFDYKKKNFEKDFAFVRGVGLCFKDIFNQIITPTNIPILSSFL